MPAKNVSKAKSVKPTPQKKVKKVTPPKKVSKAAPKAESKVEKTVEKPVVEPVVEAAVSTTTETTETTDTPYAEEFTSLVSELDTALTLVRNLKSRLQKLEKQVHRDHKATQKKLRGKKRRAPNPNAGPSGFQKPGEVSSELAKFLGLKKGELISRTDVTKAINAYVKTHKLQPQGKDEDKRKINPDAKLKKLLKMKDDDVLTFFNLQKYMKVHFPNKEGVFPKA